MLFESWRINGREICLIALMTLKEGTSGVIQHILPAEGGASHLDNLFILGSN